MTDPRKARPRRSPIFEKNVQGVFVTLTLDTRKQPANKKQIATHAFSVAVRVTYNRKSWYYATGQRLTIGDYDKVVLAKSKGKYYDIQKQLEPIHNNVCEQVKSLKNANRFSFAELKQSIGDKKTGTDKPFSMLWTEFAESKKAIKTREQYLQARKSFFVANGAKEVPDGRKIHISGRILTMKAEELTADHIEKWYQHMKNQQNSVSTQGMYLRAFRAFLYDLKEKGIIGAVPKLTIPKGERRTDSFLEVKNILKLRDYEGEGKIWADWWCIVYLCNGANLRDIAGLTWGADYDNELTFIRSKTANRSPSVVHIPITDLLKPYLDKYAAPRQKGARVFPQILLEAKTEKAIENRIHDFNADIRIGLKPICESLNIPEVSASWARNSYITTLTWHGISDAFIDDMVGHTDGKVLSGYQGKISATKRAKINSLLFTDPEEE